MGKIWGNSDEICKDKLQHRTAVWEVLDAVRLICSGRNRLGNDNAIKLNQKGWQAPLK